MKYDSKDLCAVIPIGGRGTRLKEITSDIPKPLFPINGESTLLRACKELNKYGIKKVFLSTNYNSQLCLNHTEEIKKSLDIEITSYQEEKALGECGSLWDLKNKLSETIIFINGDLIFSLEINRFLKFHKNINSLITLITHTSSHPEDSDLVSVPNGTRVSSIFLKSEKTHKSRNAYLGNAGIALFEKELLDKVDKPTDIKSSSLFHHLVRKSLKKDIRVFSYNTSEYIKDMGTPKRFSEIENDLKKNLVSRKNYSFKQKALFLDRDNTLIKCDSGKYILEDDKLIFLDKNIENIKKYAKSYDLVCIITNQPQISMGLLSIKGLDTINSVLVKYCLAKGLKIDVISFCPHHPHDGFENEINSLKLHCFCRKPSPGMIIEQSYLRNIDLEKSLFIGDSLCDQQASNSVNCPFLNVKNL